MRSNIKYYVPDEEKGGYRYIGKYYHFGATGDKLKYKKRFFFLCSILSLAAFLIAGFVDAGETRTIYIGLPYVIILLPAGFALAAAYNMLGDDESMTSPRYKRGPKMFVVCACAGTIVSAISLAGCVYLKLRGGTVAPFFPSCVLAMFMTFAAMWAMYARDPARPVG